MEEKKKYLEAYKKELNNLKYMGIFDHKIKLTRSSVQKEKKLFPLIPFLHANVTVFIKHV